MCVYITPDRVYINSTVIHKNNGDIAKIVYLVTITEVNLASVRKPRLQFSIPPIRESLHNLINVALLDSVADLKAGHKAPLPKFSVNISFPYLVLLLYINADIFCPYFT